jgi:Ni,Fe-hydrogenase I large subunit
VLLLPQRSAAANAINLDNEAALNINKLYKCQLMQGGPFAQVLIGHAQGHKLTLKWAGEAISRVSAISKKQVTPAMLHSTFGRIAARTIRASMLADLADKLVRSLSGLRDSHFRSGWEGSNQRLLKG